MFVSLVAWLWAGVVLGVSFVATPAKFLAPNLSLPEALEVGRATFGVMRYVDGFALAVLVVVVLTNNAVRTSVGQTLSKFLAAVVALLLIQYLWLLPSLDERVQAIIDGTIVESSPLHWFYVVVEILKIILLIVIGIRAYQHARVGNREGAT